MDTIKEFKLPNIQKELLSEAFERIARNLEMQENQDKKDGNPLDFENHLDGHVLGSIIAQQLPDEMLLALRNLGAGKGSPVLVLRNFPLKNDGIAQHILKALNYAMNDGYIEPFEGENSGLHSVAKDTLLRGVQLRLNHTTSKGVTSQRFHQDHVEGEIAIPMLGCILGGDKQITTDFSDGNYYFSTERVGVPISQQVALMNGDILIFRDSEIYHGRHNHGAKTTERTLSVIDALDQYPMRKPENWIQRVAERGKNLLQGI